MIATTFTVAINLKNIKVEQLFLLKNTTKQQEIAESLEHPTKIPSLL